MKLVGVIGSGDCNDDVTQTAYEVGRGIASAGHAIICGGLGGVMAGACRGAAEAGGLTIGVLPGGSPDEANRWVKIPIATGIGLARNVVIVQSAAVLIAVQGGPGTLSEIAYALQCGIPVIGIRTWDVSPEIVQVATAEDAVGAALTRL